MAIIAEVNNGQIADKTTTSSTSSSSTTSDKEMFLKLLVAEMQYQDPLEPTSNTEYVSELASFSQIEAVQSVQEQMTTLKANSLVGKYVTLNTTSSSGNSVYVSGRVDYVTTDDNDDTFLSIDGSLYNMDDLESVCDGDYYNAVMGAQEFHDTISALPNVYSLTLKDEEKLETARSTYDAMSDYEKSYLYSDDVSTLTTLEQRMEVLKEAQESKESQDNASSES